MTTPTQSQTDPSPVFSRRTFVAAAVSAVVAGGAVTLGILGGVSRVKSDSFQFSRGLNFAAGEEARLRGFLADALSDERIYVTVVGHTGDAGDAAANLELSEGRGAKVVEIASETGLSADRITALGVGGANPLPREDGESDRAYQARLARVEVALQLRR